MKRTPAAMLAVLLTGAALTGWPLSGPALAATGMTVPLPDTSHLPQAQARALMMQLAQVNVITSNCPAYAVSDGEWSLITGTGDRLAAQLGLDASAYDKQVYAPAFGLLDDPGACDRIGPTAAQLIAQLKAMGGGTTADSVSQ